MQVDWRGTVRRCNQAFAALLGLPFPEILGRSWAELAARGRLESTRECGQGCREYRHAPSGRIFCGRRYPLDDGPKERCSVIALQDISEPARISEELAAKNQELNAAYDELKSSHARLLQQEKLAAIGQLAAGMAHEINNPVGFITSNLGTMAKYLARIREFIEGLGRLFERVADEGEQAEAAALRQRLKLDYTLEDAEALLRECREGTERVKVIVQNLKGFARVDQARAGPADLNQCLEETLNIARNELKYKTEVVKHYGELPQTWCHPQQLNQVFLNLLLNAAQAIKEQGIITIKTWSKGGSIFITVTDTGAGIAPEHLPRIFEPFFTTKEVGKGTGLGLSIAYDIVVKQHGGEITAASAPGVGTTFRVRLPIRAGEQDTPKKETDRLWIK